MPTSHTRLSARNHHTSSTLISEKGGAGPSSLHTTLKGPMTEYVNARWRHSPHEFLHAIQWTMFHGHLEYFQKPHLGGKPNTKPGDHGTPNSHSRWFTLFYHVWWPAWTEIHWNSIWLRARSRKTSHYTREPVATLQHDVGGVLGRLMDTFFWALTIFMVTALGSCVEWALGVWRTQIAGIPANKVNCGGRISLVRSSWSVPLERRWEDGPPLAIIGT